MSPSDLANGLFELGGCAVVARQCLLVWRARRVAGVSWEMPAFFWSWGAWNLWYYHDLGQALSWWAAVLVLLTHSTYAALLWWFARHPRPVRWTYQPPPEAGRFWVGSYPEFPAAATASPEAAGRIPEATPRGRWDSNRWPGHDWSCRLIQEGKGPCSCREGMVP